MKIIESSDVQDNVNSSHERKTRKWETKGVLWMNAIFVCGTIPLNYRNIYSSYMLAKGFNKCFCKEK